MNCVGHRIQRACDRCLIQPYQWLDRVLVWAVTRHDHPGVDREGMVERCEVICQAKQVRNPVLGNRRLRKDHIGTKEHAVHQDPHLVRGVPRQRNHFQRRAKEILDAGLDDPFDRAGLGEQEPVPQRIERIGAAEQGRRLQYGMGDRRCLDRGRPGFTARPLADECVGPEVIGVSVGVEDGNDLGTKIVAYDTKHLACRGVIQATVDQCHMPVVVPDNSDVGAAWHETHPVSERNVHA
jgi:hypothetical protein